MTTRIADMVADIGAALKKLEEDRAKLRAEPATADVPEPVNNYPAPDWPAMYGIGTVMPDGSVRRYTDWTVPAPDYCG